MRYTTYNIATHWLDNSYVLCNEVMNEEDFWEECRFDYNNEDGDYYIDIFQTYLTDASLSEVEWLEKTFGLKFSYSNRLDCFILCVDHLGTSWKYVRQEVLDEELLKYNPDIEYIDSCYPPMFKTTREILKGGKQW